MPYPGPRADSLAHHAEADAARLADELRQRGLKVSTCGAVVRAVYALDLPYEVAATGRSKAVGLPVSLPTPEVWVEPWVETLYAKVAALFSEHRVRKGPVLKDTTVRNLLRWGAALSPEDRPSATEALLSDLKAVRDLGGEDAAKVVVKALSKQTRARRNPGA